MADYLTHRRPSRDADYIGACLELLREDERAIVRAASAASRAADFLLGFLPSEREATDEASAAGSHGASQVRNGKTV